KGAELEPACEQLAVIRIGDFTAEEAADVRVPVWDSTGREIQTRGDLPPEDFPRSANIAGPGDSGVALLAGVRGAREDECAFLRRVGTGALVYAGRVHQRIGVV